MFITLNIDMSITRILAQNIIVYSLEKENIYCNISPFLIVQKVTWITDPDTKLQFAHKSTLENSKAGKEIC